MQRYARWILQQQDQVDMVIDIHTPLNDLLRTQATNRSGLHDVE